MLPFNTKGPRFKRSKRRSREASTTSNAYVVLPVDKIRPELKRQFILVLRNLGRTRGV